MNTIYFKILLRSLVTFLAVVNASYNPVVQSQLRRLSSPFSFIHVFKRAISGANSGGGGGGGVSARSSGSGAYGLDYSAVASDSSYDPSINYLYSFNETFQIHNKHASDASSKSSKAKHGKSRHPGHPANAGGGGQQSSYSESDLINFSSGDHERSLSNLFNVNSQRPYDSIYESGNYDHTSFNYNSSFLGQNIDFSMFFNKSRSSLTNMNPAAPNANENLDPIVATLIAKIVLGKPKPLRKKTSTSQPLIFTSFFHSF